MNALEWFGLIGSLASIISLIIFFLEKKGFVPIKVSYKLIITLISITALVIMLSIYNRKNSVTIIQENDNDNNNIEILIPEK